MVSVSETWTFVYFLIHLCSVELLIPYSLHICVLLFPEFLCIHVVNLTNANGEVTKTYKYNAFGVEKDISESDTNAFRYCGEYYDTESGTIYLRARYYDPSIGRFISRDSFAGKQGDPLSLNRYTYCHNSPVVFVDCNGNFPFYHS